MDTLTHTRLFTRARLLAATFAVLLTALTLTARAQSAVSAEPPQRSAAELEELVAPVALYPDDLVAVLLPAASYPLQLVQAARVLDASGTPDSDWDESVVAVMNYPEVVEFLNEDLDWTYSLGLAFVNQEPEVLAAIQSFRATAMAAGNLRTDEYQVVSVSNGLITIRPQDTKEIYVPYYEPQRVVVRQPVPVYYYHPVARPVYYYPYPSSWVFNAGFYGVGSYFSLGWNVGGLNVFYTNQVGHPFFGRALAPRHYFYRPRVRPVRVFGARPFRHHYRAGRHIVRHPARARAKRRSNAAYRSGVRDGRQIQRRRNAIVNNRRGANRPAANRPRANAPVRVAPRNARPRATAPRVNAPRRSANGNFAANNRPARRAAGAVNRSPQARTPRNASRPGRVGRESAARRRSSARNAAAPPAVNRRGPQARRQPAMRAQPARRAAAPRAQRPRANRAPARANRASNARANRNMNRNRNRGNNRAMRGGGR